MSLAAVNVTLKDGTPAVITPHQSAATVPATVLSEMNALMNRIIDAGRTYPLENSLDEKAFSDYYCPYFLGIMTIVETGALVGAFYIKPNYPGRSSHICNGGFIVNESMRGLGAASALAVQYTAWAPLLGYRSSIFNLVFENNVASVRIWDNLGYRRVGVIHEAGRLKDDTGDKEVYVDAIVFQKVFV